MNILDKIEQEQLKAEVTPFNVGDTVKVHCRVIEGGKERVQIFQGIVIGKRGALLKEIGAQARADIQMLLGCKVFLDLWVKVKKDWRNRDNILKDFGFQD